MIRYMCAVCDHPKDFPSMPSSMPICCGKPMKGPVAMP